MRQWKVLGGTFVRLLGGGGSNSIFVCRFCEHFAKKRGGQTLMSIKALTKL